MFPLGFPYFRTPANQFGNSIFTKLGPILLLGLIPAVVGCSATPDPSPRPLEQPAIPAPATPNSSSPWQPATLAETTRLWNYLLNSPLGIAALNQLAIERFISPSCPKAFYIHQEYEEFQFLLQVQCPDSQGVSTAKEYSEMRVLFNRFEDSIESFEVERVYLDQPSKFQLPN